jgi:hypothetical protein
MAAMRGPGWLVAVLLAVVAAAAPIPTAASPAETREVIVKPREPRPDVFFLAGRVKPGYERKPGILQRRNCGGCAWFGYDHFRTDGRSRFKRPVPDLEPGDKKVCYRIKVPASNGFATAFSETSCLGPIP